MVKKAFQNIDFLPLIPCYQFYLRRALVLNLAGHKSLTSTHMAVVLFFSVLPLYPVFFAFPCKMYAVQLATIVRALSRSLILLFDGILFWPAEIMFEASKNVFILTAALAKLDVLWNFMI